MAEQYNLSTHVGKTPSVQKPEGVSVRKRVSLLGDAANGLTAEQEYLEAEKELKRKLELGEISESTAQRMIARRKMRLREGQSMESNKRGAMSDWKDERTKAMEVAKFESAQMMLDMILAKGDDDNWFLDWICEASGYNWLEAKAKKEDQRRQMDDFKHPFPATQVVVDSTYFDLSMGLVMAANAIMIGVQVSLPLDPENSEDQASQLILNVFDQIFTFIFVLEIIGRLMSEGWIWLFSGSNLFDAAVIVLTNLIPMWILLPANLSDRDIRPFAVLRMIRLLKLYKYIQKYRTFATLWTLMAGLMGSLQCLLYSIVMIATCMFVISVFCVNFIARREDLVDDEFAQLYYKDVGASWMTLFQCLTLDSWSSIVREIDPFTSACRVIMLWTIVVGEMVLCNLVTAVICEQAQKRADADDVRIAAENKEKKDKMIQDLQDLFEDIDDDRSGMIGETEFFEAYEDEEDVRYKMQALGIDDMLEFWDLMDAGPGGEVTTRKFGKTLQALIGGVLSKDTFTILRRLRHLAERVDNISELLMASQTKADAYLAETKVLHQQLANATREVRVFMQTLKGCIPPDATPAIDGRTIQKFHETVLNDCFGLPPPEDSAEFDEPPEPEPGEKKKPRLMASQMHQQITARQNRKKQKSQESLPVSDLDAAAHPNKVDEFLE